MRIYRIEHVKSGIGPFNHDSETTGRPDTTEARELAYSTDIPAPWDSTLEPYLEPWRKMPELQRNEYVFGFASRSQLRLWFSPGITKALKLLGYHVAVYEVEPQYVIAGSSQVAFMRTFARRLDTQKKIAKRRRNRRPRPEIQA